MSNEDIIAIIKWGPLLFFLLVFLFAMLLGMIKGRRKALKSAIYSFIYVMLVYFLSPVITNLLMRISIGGVTFSMRVEGLITGNDTIKNMMEAIPGLENIVRAYPMALVTLFMFVILVLIKPLMFPVYIVYSLIYGIIEKRIFKYSKYKRDEEGKILRNEKGKKIKDKKPKHGLTGGLIKGVECTLLSSVLLTPVGVITRLYEDGKNASVNRDLSSIEGIEKFKDYIDYLDAFNDSFIGKATNSIVNEKIGGYLSKVEIEGEKTTVENELSKFVVAAVYIQDSGLIKLLSEGGNLETLDLSKVNVDKLDAAIELLFESSTLKLIVADGVNYVLNSNLKETLIKLTNDGEIVNKIKYSNASEVESELLTVTKLIRDIVNSKLLTSYQSNTSNVVGIINEVTIEDVQTILNRVLSIKILSRSMPSLVTKLLKEAGLTEQLKEEDNNEFVELLLDVVKFVKTLNISNLDDIIDGNIMDNLISILYEEGAIKENSKNALSTLLSRATSSRIFDDVLVTQLNLLLDKFGITLNSQMIVNVKTQEDWNKELLVFEDIFTLYKGYQDNQTVDFLLAKELLNDLKNTNAIILALPISYQKLFPLIGIEVDLNKIKYIDYSDENANQEEVEFYTYWRSQLVHFDTISEELAKLQITSFSDISFNLLEEEENVDALATIISEVFSADLLKDGVSAKLDELLSDLLKEYEMSLNDEAISNVNNLVNTMPYYIIDNQKEVDIEIRDNKYYIGSSEVIIEGNTVSYKGNQYVRMNNSLKRIWKNELSNLSVIITAIKSGKYTDKETLTKILNAVDSMYLLKDVKTDLLIYAVKQINIVTIDDENKENISFTKEKDILLNVIDKYDLLKDIATMDFKTIDDETISDLSFVLENVLQSDIFGDYAASNIVTISKSAGVELEKETVLQADTWESDLKLIRTASNMSEQTFDKETLESLLNGIEDSSLLTNNKNQILIDTVKKSNIDGVSVADNVKAEDLVYADEKNAILVASDNLSLLEEMSQPGFDLATVDSERLATILSSSLKSKLFAPSVIDTLVDVFNKNSIKHDLDAVGSDTMLRNSIKAIGSKQQWKLEIELIQSLLGIDKKEEVNATLFYNLEHSALLGGCRANLLLRMIKEIDENQPDLNLNSDITVSDLVDSQTYKQYAIERDVLINLITLTDVVSLDDVTMESKSYFAPLLNKMRDSDVFVKQYSDIVPKLVNSMSTNEELSNWGLTINNNPTIADWDKELTALLTIRDNANAINGMDITSIDVEKVGTTLDQLDKSVIISGSDAAANAIVKKITGVSTESISKQGHTSWVNAFRAKFNK